jgi:hypothetical protein
MIAHSSYKNLTFITSILLTTTTHTMRFSECYQESMALHQPIRKFQTYSQRMALYHECKLAIEAEKPLNQFHPQLDLDFTDENGTSLLHVAVDADHHEAVADFLKKGANPNQKNVHHITPLQLAIENQSRNCCLKLIQHGATKESMYVYRTDTNSGRSKKLYDYEGQKIKKSNEKEYNADKKKYFAFMAPVHSALISKELMPLYRRQQKNMTLFPNFILRHYLCQYRVGITPIFEYLTRQSELQQVRFFIIHKFLEVSDCPIL